MTTNPDDGYFEKRSYDEYNFTMQYAGKLPAGTSLQSVAVTAIDQSTGLDATSLVLSGTAAVVGTDATQYVKGGTAGRSYKLSWKAELTPNGKLEDVLIMRILK